jgi:hypothetical protein
VHPLESYQLSAISFQQNRTTQAHNASLSNRQGAEAQDLFSTETTLKTFCIARRCLLRGLGSLFLLSVLSKKTQYIEYFVMLYIRPAATLLTQRLIEPRRCTKSEKQVGHRTGYKDGTVKTAEGIFRVSGRRFGDGRNRLSKFISL